LRSHCAIPQRLRLDFVAIARSRHDGARTAKATAKRFRGDKAIKTRLCNGWKSDRKVISRRLQIKRTAIENPSRYYFVTIAWKLQSDYVEISQ
jgi:hypothetical protein